MVRRIFCLAALLVAPGLVGEPGWAQHAFADQPPLTGGFIDHLQATPGGRIDWTSGYILAEGVGYGQGVDKQQELLAERAATVVAARNALAMAKGIRLDAWTAVGDMGEGQVRLEGIVKGHKIVESRWEPQADPPACHVVLRVPLWGVKSVSSVFRKSQSARLRRARAERSRLPVGRADVSDFVLVLDARGLKLRPCLFPCVVDQNGRVIYDLNTLTPESAARKALARYVESSQPFEHLQAALRSQYGVRLLLARYQPVGDGPEDRLEPAPTSRPTSQPSSQPAGKGKRRAKRRMVLRGAEATGAARTQLVLTREDVERLRRSPEGAAALHNAQVLIVVDAAAAGTEGRLWTLPGGAVAAISP